jgi:F-type H+-transporting ATPase subunit gamma
MATANMKDVKRRIKSVESTKQITKAMQLVATSKMRRAKERAVAVQPFFETLFNAMCDISSDSNFTSVFTTKVEKKKTLMIVIAGDRGLAGGFNVNVLKKAAAKAEELKQKGRTVSIMAIGKKAVEYFSKRDYNVTDSFSEIAEGLSMYGSMDIAEDIAARFKAGEFDSVDLIYTTFVSAITQEPCEMAILPVENLTSWANTRHAAPIYDPSPEEVFEGMIPTYLCGLLYSAIVDSFASEQAARRAAMESATDNADEMIENLSLMYNRARQDQITQELTEISSASLNDSV